MKDIYALFRHSLAGLRCCSPRPSLLGVAYPLLVTGVAQVAAPWRANGSLVTASGDHTTDADEAVGSALIGQLGRRPGASSSRDRRPPETATTRCRLRLQPRPGGRPT